MDDQKLVLSICLLLLNREYSSLIDIKNLGSCVSVFSTFYFYVIFAANLACLKSSSDVLSFSLNLRFHFAINLVLTSLVLTKKNVR